MLRRGMLRGAVVALLLSLAHAGIAAEAATTPSALAAKIEAGDAPLVLDVRTHDEYAAGHVPGAILIPHDQLEDRITELGEPRDVVVYCRSGRRSGLAEPVLEAHGFRVSQLEGSWNAWEAAGMPKAVGADPVLTDPPADAGAPIDNEVKP